MASRTQLVVQDGCPVCEFVEQALKASGVEVEIVNASTKEGFDFAKAQGIKTIPACLVVEPGEDGEKTRLCTDAEYKELLDGKKK